MFIKNCRFFNSLDTNILNPDFSSGSLISIYRQKLPGLSYPLQNLFSIRVISVPHQFFQEFIVNPVFLIKGFSKDQALSTIGKGGFFLGKIPIFGDLYAFINTIPLNLGRNCNIIPLIKKMAIKVIRPEIVIKNNSGDNNNSNNKDILNNKNFSGKGL